LTFADAAEKVRYGDSGHSQVAITDLGKVPAERLHSKAAYSRCRPTPESHCPELVGATQPSARIASATVRAEVSFRR
jgi:hypothetical protein